MENYESKAKTTTIKCTSRCSVNIGTSYYTVEYAEERSISEDCDLNMEREILWNDVNAEVDMQIEDIYKTFGAKK